MPRTKSAPEIYIAKHGFACEIDGVPMFINPGERVRKGHELLERCGEYFEPADTHVKYDVEQATAAPGEKRGE
jgi:hypothetical protein